MNQLSLFQRTGPITRKFWEFHLANPQVFKELMRLALDLKRKGVMKYGIGSLFEVIRWHRAMETNGSVFKLNNNYRALYARELMKYEPKLDGFFEIRSSPNPQVIE